MDYFPYDLARKARESIKPRMESVGETEKIGSDVDVLKSESAGVKDKFDRVLRSRAEELICEGIMELG